MTFNVERTAKGYKITSSVPIMEPLDLDRVSEKTAHAVKTALESVYGAAERARAHTQDSFDHGVSVGYRESREENYALGVEDGRREMFEEIWAKPDVSGR